MSQYSEGKSKTMSASHIREMAQFMPAILEIQTAPSNPIAKWLGRTLMALFVFAIAWSWFGQVNIVATAEGQIVAITQPEVIKLPTAGKVIESQVTDGQKVSLGQSMVTIQPESGELYTIVAPFSGTVKQITPNILNSNVPIDAYLFSIEPDEEQLQIEALLENKDIGFVSKGMSSEVKVHTFAFTKYGVIDSELIEVADNAQISPNGGLSYVIKSNLMNTEMMIDGIPKSLIPGMQVTVEIQIGKRRIIEFFLAPLLRYKQESLKER